MKKIKAYSLLVLIILGTSACEKEPNSPNATSGSPSNPNFYGEVLFWTDDASIFNSCSSIQIKLSSGVQASISTPYTTAPTGCNNTKGGYFFLNEGAYTYTLSSSGGVCINKTGSMNVIGNGCTQVKVTP